MVKLTKKQVAIILLLFAALLITVGLLAGLIKPQTFSLSDRQPAVTSDSILNPAEPWLNTRLPRHIVPVHYDLSLFPDLYDVEQDDARFSGNVSILINITSEPTRHLLVHANKLTIHRTSVRLHQSPKTTQHDAVHVHRAFNFTRNQYWVVELDRDLQPGSAVWLEMRFEGSMIGKLTGLYRTSYVDSRTRQKRFHDSSFTSLSSSSSSSSSPLLTYCVLRSTQPPTLSETGNEMRCLGQLTQPSIPSGTIK